MKTLPSQEKLSTYRGRFRRRRVALRRIIAAGDAIYADSAKFNETASESFCIAVSLPP